MRAALAGEAPDAASRRRARVMRVGYLGPAGHVQRGGAARRPRAGDGRARAAADDPRGGAWPSTTARSTARSCPIENSLEGGGQRDARRARAATRRTWRSSARPCSPIRHCLIAREAIALDAIEAVVSHPQPLAQCARFLRSGCRGAAVRAADLDRRGGAHASPSATSRGPRSARALAAELYGCRVLRDGVEDEPGNATRFVWLGAAPAARRRADGAGAWKTSVVFSGAGDAQPGWLVRCLSEFAFRGVNLTQDRVAPARAAARATTCSSSTARAAADEPAVADAVAALARALRGGPRCSGSYPAA